MATRNPVSIVGISAFYHDSAAALVVDGDIVAAAQEERFSRKRHDAAFPARALEYCLAEGGIAPEEVSYVVFYDKPLKKLDRILETYFAHAPEGFWSFRKALPLWLKEKLHIPREIRRGLHGRFRGTMVFTDHHQSHAASAFFPSPYEEAAILTMDGVGEWATTTWGTGRGNQIAIARAISFPHSLGLLYSAFTYHAGFRVNSGEYKLMGLAPYGEPVYAELIKKHLIDIKPDGSYRLAMEYFDYCAGLKMTDPKFDRLFGGPPRAKEGEITRRERDLAASIQAVTEEIVLLTARHVHRITGMKRLCLAGGVALNCVANGRVLREGPFDDVWIQPAAGDAGGALGAALFTWYQLLEHRRVATGTDTQKGSYLGPSYGLEATKAFLDTTAARYHVFDREEDLLDLVSARLAGGAVVGWSHGRMEFGPRALGARSILGDPRDETMQSRMNLKIKHRESFRPFAPCVLRERAHEIFEMSEATESPYMLLVARVREKYRRVLTAEQQTAMLDEDLRARVNVPRSDFPAITHVDYSARIQTVDEPRHGRFYRLMKAFEAKTGCPCLVNTSFNVRGEPIVNTPAEAYEGFLHTGMDLLVLGDVVLFKSEQPAVPAAAQQQHLSRFALD